MLTERPIWKLNSLVRFFLLRILYRNRISANGLSLLSWTASFRVSRSGNVSLGSKVIIQPFAEIQCNGKIRIGNRCDINRYSRLVAMQEISIGDNVAIAQFVSILDHDHQFLLDGDGILSISRKYECGPIRIGNNVWIGDKVTITKDVNIGDNVVIGANSVVTRDIPSNCVAAGVPCKPVFHAKTATQV